MVNNPEYGREFRRLHPLYDVWAEMKQRCTNPNKQNYPRYGGRGVTVCARWMQSFSAFEADMGERPSGMTLERIDNNGPYEPANCRWASMREQARNKRSNRVLDLDGRSMTIADWAEETGIDSRTIRSRIDKYGWSIRTALTAPVRQKRGVAA